MKVFNLYMKIIKKNLGSIMVYLTVFATLSIIMTFSSIKDSNNAFVQTKTNIAFFDQDNTIISQELKKNLEQVADIQDIQEDETVLKDALFFRKINAIVRIEKGFSDKLLHNETVTVEVNTIPNTYESTYVELAINNYIDTAKKYIQTTDMTQEELIQKVTSDLEKTTKTEFTKEEISSDVAGSYLFFNYLSYVLLAVIILGIGVTMSVLNDKMIKRRMLCAPISYRRFNIELTLGHFVYAIGILLILLAFWFIPRMYLLAQPVGILLILNAICIILAIISMGFLIGTLIKGKEAQSAACNVISLGCSFMGGVFVPQEWLNPIVIKIANFTPIYWYVLANNKIKEITSFQQPEVKSILMYMGIELGFAITLWLIALVIAKNKRTSE